MARAVDRLILKKTGVDPNLSESHIRCICHKIALILNEGLKSIQISSKGLIPQNDNADTLGFIPGLTPIIEESKEIEPSDDFVPEDILLEDDNEEEECRLRNDSSEEENLPEEPRKRKKQLDSILKKVDFVIQRITCSAAKQSEYNTWCKKLDYDGPSLIAGYGIRWNIKFQSRDRGYRARKIISKLLENERDRQEREGGKNYYNKIEILRQEWDVVHKLNDMLGEFYFLTKKMEGDHSSACLMISEYQYMQAFIKEKMKSTTPAEIEFRQMLQAMASKTETYLSEALACDVILVATALNPSFRLSMFKMSFPTHYTYTLDLLTRLFRKQKAMFDSTAVTKETAPPVHDSHQKIKRAVAEVDYFPDAVDIGPLDDELNIYLEGKYKLPTSEAGECLKWWKDHGHEFPILAPLARDYLSSLATSASVERCFSAAADICGGDRGSMAAKTIERCVSSHQWLVQGLEPDGSFEVAQNIITQATRPAQD